MPLFHPNTYVVFLTIKQRLGEGEGGLFAISFIFCLSKNHEDLIRGRHILLPFTATTVRYMPTNAFITHCVRNTSANLQKGGRIYLYYGIFSAHTPQPHRHLDTQTTSQRQFQSVWRVLFLGLKLRAKRIVWTRPYLAPPRRGVTAQIGKPISGKTKAIVRRANQIKSKPELNLAERRHPSF